MNNNKEQKIFCVMKIGGSVITQKHRSSVVVRRKMIESFSRDLYIYTEQHPKDRCIVVHGAGSAGHRVAHQYGLASGVGSDTNKWKGAVLARSADQRLNGIVFETMLRNKLRAIPVHTSSVIIQRDGKIVSFFLNPIREALKNGCIPILYGDMVFDENLGMSICSGDDIAAYLADKFFAKSLLFASDVDGIYDKDPHRYRKVKKIASIQLKELLNNKDVSLEGSHHVDVTGGLYNKIASLSHDYSLIGTERVVIFDGRKKHALLAVLNGEQRGTEIRMR